MFCHKTTQKESGGAACCDFKGGNEVKRRSGSPYISDMGDYTCNTAVITGRNVVHRHDSGISSLTSTTKILGEVIKTIDTSVIPCNCMAADAVQAELERLRGEKKDPALQAIQLTSAFWFANTEYTSVFAIFKPVAGN
jgi:hypothetical protein